MQIYTDANGVQQYTLGTISIDSDSGLPVLPVLWSGEFDLTKVGGYTVVNGELVYSQAAFDANQLLKVQVANAEATALLAKMKQIASDITEAAHAEAIKHRAILNMTRKELNLLRTELRAMRTNAAAAANTVAGVKSVFAAISAMNDRTPSQVKTAYKSEVTADGGNLD